MPDIKTWKVEAPDGTLVSFNAPSTMAPEDVIARAQQEYRFQTGKIPTTFAQGARQSIGETIADKSGLIGTGVGLAGALAGQPEIVAASPFVGRGVQAAGEAIAGRPLTPTNLNEVSQMAAEGALAGYGGKAVANAAESIAGSAAARGHGFWPWAINYARSTAPTVAAAAEHATPKAVGTAVMKDIATGRQVAQTVGDTAARMKAGVSAEDLKLLMDNINNGMAPSTAAKIVSGGNPSYMSKLMTLYMRSRMRP